VENPLASMFHIHSYSAHKTVLYGEQHESIYISNPAITENTECSIIRAHALVKVAVSLSHGISLCTLNMLGNILSREKRKSHTANRHLRSSGERNGVQRRTRANSWCKHWSCCSCTSQDEVTLNNEKNQAFSYSHYRVKLASVSKSVDQSVSRKFC